MPAEILQNMIISLNHINTSFGYEDGKSQYVIDEIRSHDYLTVVRRDINGFDHFLIPNIDYIVRDRMDNNVWKGTIFDVINSNNWNNGDIIYITGLKLSYGKAGR